MTSIDAIKKAVRPTNKQYDGYSRSSRVEEVVAELKADPKYSTWSDVELEDYASGLLLNKATRAANLQMQGALSGLNHPLDAEWSQYSYEEILQMEDEGVVIPEEFLKWAHSMQAANTVEYELGSNETASDTDADSLQTNVDGETGDYAKVKAAKTLNKKVILQEEAINQAAVEFEQYSTKLDTATHDAQYMQSATLKKVQEMMEEFQILDEKVKSGEELSPGEKARYGELGILADNEVKASQVQIENFTADFDEITKLMQTSSKTVALGKNYAEDAANLGKEIAGYEVKHSAVSVSGNNHVFDGATGIVGLLKANSVAKDFSSKSVKSGNELKSVVFDSDNAIKGLGAQMKALTKGINNGDDEISNTVKTSNEEITPEPKKEEAKAVEPPPSEDNPEVLQQAAQTKDNEEENVFAKQEDFNDINSILKRQQRKDPEIPQQEVVVDS